MNEITVFGFGGGVHLRLAAFVASLALAAMLASACGGGSNSAPTPLENSPAALTGNSAAIAEILAAPVPDGVNPALWETLTQELAAQLAARRTSTYNVSWLWGTLAISSKDEGGQPYLVWDNSFFHWDGNGDGVTNVSDITPLAQYYGEQVSSFPAAGVADYNWDGKVDIADITPLALHFGERCVEFVIQRSGVSRGAGYIDVATVGYRETTGIDENGYGVYEVPADFAETTPMWVRVVALDEAGAVIDYDPMLWRGYHCEATTVPPFPVDDLEVSGVSPPAITWSTHFFTSDGNQDGTVNVSDTTPIAVVIAGHGEGCSVDDVPQAAVADYDRSGFVDIKDVEVLTDTYGESVGSFIVEVSAVSPNEGFNVDGCVLHADWVSVPVGGFVHYEYDVSSPPEGVPFWVRVTPFDQNGFSGVPCVPVQFGEVQ
jgi:hypothetical protein